MHRQQVLVEPQGELGSLLGKANIHLFDRGELAKVELNIVGVVKHPIEILPLNNHPLAL